ncbi:MAG: flippase [Candidatus Pacearchaeota archaeon]
MEETKEEDLNQGLKLLVKSSIVVFIGLFLSKVLFYVYRFIIARFFGPEIYGVFSLALAIFIIFTLFPMLGFDRGILRFVSLYRGERNTQKIKYLVSFSIKFLLVSSIFASIILFSLADIISSKIFDNSNLVPFLKIFSFIIPLFIFSTFFLSIIRAYEKISWYSFILNILQNILKPISLLVLIYLGFSLNSISYSYSIGILGMLVASYIFCRISFPTIFKKSKLKKKNKLILRRDFLVYSWPIMFFGVVNTIFFWIGSFSIGYFKGALEVGFYNAAVPLASLLGFFPELFIQLFFPLITREYSKKNLNVIKELSKQLGKWIFILNLPLFIILFFFPGAIINLLFGKEYIIAETALRILSVGTFIACSTIYISDNLLSMKGKSKLIMINIIFAAILNFLLNIFLVPRYGITGAAMSATITQVLLGLALIIETKYYLSIIPIRRKMFKILFISLIPTILLFYSRKIILINFLSMFLLGFLFLSVYILLILITNCLDKNDFVVLRSILNFKRFNHFFQS